MTAITDYFKGLWVIDDRGGCPIPQVSLEGGAFPAFLEVDISGNEFEVPTPLVPYVVSAKRAGCTKLVYNLLNGADNMGRRTFHKKTVNTILKQFRDASSRGNGMNGCNMRLAHVITSKNLHYYGCQGMIFDGSYKPLMLATIIVRYDAEHGIHLVNPKFRLSYDVFENATEIVEKTLIKQAIPYYADEGVNVLFHGDWHATSTSVEIVIGHMGSMIVKPMIPTLSIVSMTNFNNIIANHHEAC